MKIRTLLNDRRGAATIELAFALPILVVLIWMMVQLGLVFRATSGIQHALGEGARYATIWPKPSNAAIRQRVLDKVYGIGPGRFDVPTPTPGADCAGACIDLTVSYTQRTDLLLLPGPTVTVSRSKRVWTAD